MTIVQIFQTVIRNLLANRVRAAQSMLAAIIGVAGVMVVMLLSFSLLNLNTTMYDESAPGSFNTYVSQNANYPKAVTEADMEQFAEDNPEVIKAISPLVWSMDMSWQLRNEDRVYETGAFYGVGESYLECYPDLYVQEGRFLQYMDISQEQRVCVIGNNIAQELFDGNALGKTVKIWGENYTVVGVLVDRPFSYGINGKVLIPYSVARKLLGETIHSYNFYQDQYVVVANGVENMYETQLILQEMLREKTGGETGSVYDPGTKWTLSMYAYASIGELMKGGIYQIIYAGLLAAGFILLIGCVGIMNMMLAFVQERKKEIGIRKAFGATNKDIQRQFTLEAVITSMIGGMIGMAFGLVVVWLINITETIIPVNGGYPYYVRWEDMNWLTIGVSVLVPLLISVGVGVISAAYPAQQAAKMEIVEAINSD